MDWAGHWEWYNAYCHYSFSQRSEIFSGQAATSCLPSLDVVGSALAPMCFIVRRLQWCWGHLEYQYDVQLVLRAATSGYRNMWWHLGACDQHPVQLMGQASDLRAQTGSVLQIQDLVFTQHPMCLPEQLVKSREHIYQLLIKEQTACVSAKSVSPYYQVS